MSKDGGRVDAAGEMRAPASGIGTTDIGKN